MKDQKASSLNIIGDHYDHYNQSSYQTKEDYLGSNSNSRLESEQS